MEKKLVQSSMIKSVAHDIEPDGPTLIVEFHNGKIYRYLDVEREIYDAMIASDSIGTYFNQHIKNNYVVEATQDEVAKLEYDAFMAKKPKSFLMPFRPFKK